MEWICLGPRDRSAQLQLFTPSRLMGQRSRAKAFDSHSLKWGKWPREVSGGWGYDFAGIPKTAIPIKANCHPMSS